MGTSLSAPIICVHYTARAASRVYTYLMACLNKGDLIRMVEPTRASHGCLIYGVGLGKFMPKGLKQTSSLITISAAVTEPAADTFTQRQVDLQLNPLDNEVFVVQAVNLDPSPPDLQLGLNSFTTCSMSTTSRTTIGTLANSDVLATASRDIRTDAGGAAGSVSFEQTSMETPPAGLDYVGIIATNDFFLQIQGGNNLIAKDLRVKVYGYRARADASQYAALVQSEVLSQ